MTFLVRVLSAEPTIGFVHRYIGFFTNVTFLVRVLSADLLCRSVVTLSDAVTEVNCISDSYTEISDSVTEVVREDYRIRSPSATFAVLLWV
jgi:hypothetical protein